MSYDAPRIEGETDPEFQGNAGGFPLWEVFVRASRGLSHVHAGSVHAADAESPKAKRPTQGSQEVGAGTALL